MMGADDTIEQLNRDFETLHSTFDYFRSNFENSGPVQKTYEEGSVVLETACHLIEALRTENMLLKMEHGLFDNGEMISAH